MTTDDRGRLIFSRSSEAPLLLQDVRQGKHETMNYEALWASRPECMVFSKQELQRRVYQAVGTLKWYNYLEIKRKEKAETLAKRYKDKAAELDKKHGGNNKLIELSKDLISVM